jgi:hypothetical protein
MVSCCAISVGSVLLTSSCGGGGGSGGDGAQVAPVELEGLTVAAGGAQATLKQGGAAGLCLGHRGRYRYADGWFFRSLA